MDWTFLVGRGGAGGEATRSSASSSLEIVKGKRMKTQRARRYGGSRRKGGAGGGTRLRTEPAGLRRTETRKTGSDRGLRASQSGDNTRPAAGRTPHGPRPRVEEGPAGTPRAAMMGGRSAGTPRAAGPALPRDTRPALSRRLGSGSAGQGRGGGRRKTGTRGPKGEGAPGGGEGGGGARGFGHLSEAVRAVAGSSPSPGTER